MDVLVTEMRRILYIGNHLSKHGLSPSVAETLAPMLMPEVKLRLVSSHRNQLLRLLAMLSSVIRYGKEEGPVVIDVYSSLSFWYAVIVSIVCRLVRVPYIAVLHGGNLPRRLKGSRRSCRVLLSKADRIVSPSAYLKQECAQFGYGVEIIPNTIRMDNYPFIPRNEIKARLLWVRAFDSIYNPSMAVRVLHELSKTYPNATLCMVGPDKDGSLDACSKLTRSLGLEDRVRITGRLSKKQWIELSPKHDLFINTSNFDNTPVSVIEAMALGLPVVSTNAGGMPYLIQHGQNGLLVDREDVSGMCNAILVLMKDQVLACSISRRARERVEFFDCKYAKPLWLKALGVTSVA